MHVCNYACLMYVRVLINLFLFICPSLSVLIADCLSLQVWQMNEEQAIDLATRVLQAQKVAVWVRLARSHGCKSCMSSS